MQFADVKAAVREHMTEKGESNTVSVVIHLAGRFSVSLEPNPWSGYRSGEGVTFEGQVGRALNQLADEGHLLKTVRYTVGRRKEAFWTTREVAEAKAQAQAARAAELEAEKDKHELLAARFAAARYDVKITGDGSVVIAPGDAERLLGEIRAPN